MQIRPATDADHDAIWKIFYEIVATGDTYALDPKISREDALAYWFGPNTRTYVAELSRPDVGDAVAFPGTSPQSPAKADKSATIAGTYILKPNQSGPGSHVANAGFMVALDAQCSGVGRAMAEHCLGEARRFGFRAMQFNFVVSTNTPAIHLWQKLGFEIVGTLPGAFRHPAKGYVDAYVMYRSLL